MKIVNPIGREVMSMSDSNLVRQPRACMCHTDAGYAEARGAGGCFTCGCSCAGDVTVTSGNSNKSFWKVSR
ncbi:Apre_1838 family putative sactipeptide bacteriocin [Romboutsia sedimentorum]|uniref:Apre_1838 family putative sactipeptide bacteriocin n=1 Tax=Romboutsia sedimentorum TaxID=1368474 RepID=UPI0024DE8C92|nr:Apre_1838 family putative sactipeptide bacteriocin [Romboutsia sedimentorum]MDK2587345.1 Apre_1838 family putative sactipeptide bacteriocin [Romboutsia sedimentorum]